MRAVATADITRVLFVCAAIGITSFIGLTRLVPSESCIRRLHVGVLLAGTCASIDFCHVIHCHGVLIQGRGADDLSHAAEIGFLGADCVLRLYTPGPIISVQLQLTSS